jgi:hypothetical protein
LSHKCLNRGELKLSSCNVRECEARCCYDGAYIEPDEEKFLQELVQRVPELMAKLPKEFIVDGHWEGELLGRKTATRAHHYSSADYPAHFAHTRCVFADDVGFCELEKLARSRGQHPWSFKPSTCWLHPLHEEAGLPVAPVQGSQDDPYRTKNYAGYSPFGRPWRDALAAELQYLQDAEAMPLLGSPGHTVDELLQPIQQVKKNPA